MPDDPARLPDAFQCSSASRKFLNADSDALFPSAWRVSVLFSEPKIPQLINQQRAGEYSIRFSALQRAENSSILPSASRDVHECNVSVLFSEPKIPQLGAPSTRRQPRLSFQCSSASRKFLNHQQYAEQHQQYAFQCSSASRKFLNDAATSGAFTRPRVSVLFSEPKIPQ